VYRRPCPDRDQPEDIIATLRDAVAPGSYLVICHACRDEQPSLATSFETVYNSRVTAQLNMPATTGPRPPPDRFVRGNEILFAERTVVQAVRDSVNASRSM